MGNTVTRLPPPGRWGGSAGGLYSARGRRKYLTRGERQRALEATADIDPGQGLFAIMLAWTGARVSELLAVTPDDCDLERSVICLRTLKRRKPVVREVPVPPASMLLLDQHFGLRARRLDTHARYARLWPVSRVTAWRWIKSLMEAADISGAPACPRGFRHGYGVLALHSGIPINLLQRWLGHSRLTSTAIYADAAGPDEFLLAERLWDGPGIYHVSTSEAMRHAAADGSYL